MWIVSEAKSFVYSVTHAHQDQGADHDEENDQGLRYGIFFVALGNMVGCFGRAEEHVLVGDEHWATMVAWSCESSGDWELNYSEIQYCLALRLV